MPSTNHDEMEHIGNRQRKRMWQYKKKGQSWLTGAAAADAAAAAAAAVTTTAAARCRQSDAAAQTLKRSA